MESYIQPFKYLRDVDNHKIGETLRKLVTNNLLKLGQVEKPAKCFKGEGHSRKRTLFVITNKKFILSLVTHRSFSF